MTFFITCLKSCPRDCFLGLYKWQPYDGPCLVVGVVPLLLGAFVVRARGSTPSATVVTLLASNSPMLLEVLGGGMSSIGGIMLVSLGGRVPSLSPSSPLFPPLPLHLPVLLEKSPPW